MTKEEKRDYHAAWYQAHKDEARAYYDANKEEILAARAEYYGGHKDEVLARVAARYEANRDGVLAQQAKRRAGFTEWLQLLRTVSGCSDCKTHEGTLQHHHLDPTTKRRSVSNMAGSSQETLQAEIAKCVVVCEPCHRDRHNAMKALAA